MITIAVNKPIDIIKVCTTATTLPDGERTMVRLIPGGNLNITDALVINDVLRLFSYTFNFSVELHRDVDVLDLCAYSSVPRDNRFISNTAMMVFERYYSEYHNVKYDDFTLLAALDDQRWSEVLRVTALGYNYNSDSINGFCLNQVATTADDLIVNNVFDHTTCASQKRWKDRLADDVSEKQRVADVGIVNADVDIYVTGELTVEVVASVIKELEDTRAAGKTMATIWFNVEDEGHMDEGMMLAEVINRIMIKVVGIGVGVVSGGALMALAACNNDDRLSTPNTVFVLAPYTIDTLSSRQGSLISAISRGRNWYELLQKFTFKDAKKLRQVFDTKAYVLSSEAIKVGVLDNTI